MTRENQRAVQAAHGYFELGMMEEAWAALQTLSASERDQPDALQIEAILWIKQENWEKGLEVSRRLCEQDTGSCAGYIHHAYCLHELGYTAEAREFLLSGPDALADEAIFYYNLGCYQAQLGDLEDARELLRRAFEMDKKLVEVAKNDPDLAGLWATL